METIDQNTENVPVAPVAQVPIPNSQGILILGIFSLVTTVCCMFIFFVGLVLGIIAVVMSVKAIEIYQQNPKVYTPASYKNVNAGRICGIIGIVLSGTILLFGLIMLIFMGGILTEFFQDLPWEDFLN
jgi:hypothetical protein